MASDASQTSYEDTYVHQVYDEIASHFSSTRFKPWPVVDDFLKALPKYSVGLDIGCGNGKYLTVRDDVFIVASDRSPELLKFATRHQPHSAVVSDVLNLAHPPNAFDFAICIAVIHHLSTPQRRREALKAILNTLRPSYNSSNIIIDSSNSTSRGQSSQYDSNTTPIPAARESSDSTYGASRHRPAQQRSNSGQALVFVWALEQKTSRRGWDAGMNQDVLVPWVLKTEHDRKGRPSSSTTTRTSTPANPPGISPPAPDNNTTFASPTTSETEPKEPPKENSNADQSGDLLPQSHPQRRQERTLNRYYHLYRQGELEEDIVAVGGKVVKNGYDRDNWWAIFERNLDFEE